MTRFVAISSQGDIVRIKRHPRKELLEYFGASRADRVYCDGEDGKPVHLGYRVRGRWFTIYALTAWEGTKR